jgi:5-methylcytosine-specific restriction endonuclease McrA
MNNTIWQKEHKRYCRSPYFKHISAVVLERDGGRCRLCNRPAKVVHHRRYTTKGIFTQEVNDCISLCMACHHAFHKNRTLAEERLEETDLIYDVKTQAYRKKACESETN